jgi:hypothetical protein
MNRRDFLAKVFAGIGAGAVVLLPEPEKVDGAVETTAGALTINGTQLLIRVGNDKYNLLSFIERDINIEYRQPVHLKRKKGKKYYIAGEPRGKLTTSWLHMRAEDIVNLANPERPSEIHLFFMMDVGPLMHYVARNVVLVSFKEAREHRLPAFDVPVIRVVEPVFQFTKFCLYPSERDIFGDRQPGVAIEVPELRSDIFGRKKQT